MASHEANAKSNNEYINQLIKEQEAIGNVKSPLARKLIQQEIDKIRSADPADDSRRDGHVTIHSGKMFRLRVKVHIPVEEHPTFNYVGKLLGPKGSSLQQLQEATQTRMAILGRGSMRDKKKEEDMRKQGDPKYTHLNEELHVEVTAYASPAEAYRRMSGAIAELQRFMVPDFYDERPPPPQFMNDNKPPKPYGGDAPHMPPPPRGGPPMRGGRAMGGPPMMDRREEREPPPPRRPMVQSTYVSDQDEWASPRGREPVPPRRGAYHGNSSPAPARPTRSYEDQGDDYNNYPSDNFGADYNSRSSAPYDDYNPPDNYGGGYSDGYADNGAPGPMRNAPGGRGGGPRNNARGQSHPYAGATRRY